MLTPFSTVRCAISRRQDGFKVKVREELSTEDVVEVTSEIANKNQEITANYFYYQLLREYVVRTEFYDVRPVLLRARDLPRSAAIDERFLSNYAHLLIPVLPLQLAVDLQETVHEIDPAVRAMIRRNAEAQERRVTYERARTETPPAAPEERNAWQIRVNRLYEDVALARAEFITAEGQYVRLQSRLDRVITYVRENIAHLMQFIWNRKLSWTVLLEKKISPFFSISPRLITYFQKPHVQNLIGLNGKFALNDDRSNHFYAGLWGRLSNQLESFGPETLSIFTGLQIGEFNIGLSYDTNLSGFSQNFYGRGIFELSLIVIGNYSHEGLFCPSF